MNVPSMNRDDFWKTLKFFMIGRKYFATGN